MRTQRFAPLLVAAGLVATTAPLLSATQASAAPTASYLKQKPAWQRCAPDAPAAYECATIKVPLDYRRPEGRMIDLAISRMKSENPGARHGALLLNPGGPGGSGLYDPVLMNDAMAKDVRDRYDLIGFDPRGVGSSSPVSCGLTDAEQQFDRAYRPETFSSDVAWARTVAEKCREKAGSVLPHITTRNTARDMDTIRAVLGERKISYLGYSYGTYLGAVYTQMFPQRADRVVLDSGVDPQLIWRGMIQVWASEAEPAYDRWTRWAAERSAQYQLGDTPEAVSATFWALVARADRDPIVLDGQKLNGDGIRAGRALFFYPAQATPIIVALKAAAEGRPLPAGTSAAELKRMLAEARGPAQAVRPSGAPAAPATAPATAPVPAPDNAVAVFWSVLCGDTDAWPRDPEQYRRDAIEDKAAYPLYGDFASNIKPCAFWQRPVEKATPMKTRANVLTVQNEWDSQTPLSSGRGLHHALKGSREILVEGGEGHGVYAAGPTCANALVDAYLTTGKLPAKDLTCKNPPALAERQASPNPLRPLPFPAGPGRF
ncbi:alpha/beta hydrolase [Streptomyces sp. NPDC051567]|uniref:alpha/beta hydrolase n=1 Tax=Streptomyces sp. NPDC051567 TaxID=3365660 RepID=UPI0037BD93FF